MLTLLNISENEWKAAEAFFNDNPNEIKLNKKDFIKEGTIRHSFIKINKIIYALQSSWEEKISPKTGGCKVVKKCQKIDGTLYALGIYGGENSRNKSLHQFLIDSNYLIDFFEISSAKYKTIKANKSYSTKIKTYEIMPFYGENNLFEFLMKESKTSTYFFKNLNETTLRFIVLKCAIEVLKLHQAGFIHGDIKLANFCIDDKGNIKLIDYDTSIKAPHDSNGCVKNKNFLPGEDYSAPETQKGLYCSKSDVYALGKLKEYLDLSKSDYENLIKTEIADRSELKDVVQTLLIKCNTANLTFTQQIFPQENFEAFFKECDRLLSVNNIDKNMVDAVANLSLIDSLNNSFTPNYKHGVQNLETVQLSPTHLNSQKLTFEKIIK